MPRRFTLGDLVLRCKRRCDREFDENISTTEWKGYISSLYGELFGAVAETGLRYFETVEEITADGSASYAEPASHLSTVGIDLVNAQGDRRELVELMAQERHAFAGQTGEARAFMLIDDQLFLYPRPSTGTYEWIYIPQPPDLTEGDDDDYIDVVTPDGESFVLWGVTVMAQFKQGSDTRDAERQRDQARQRITEWAVLRALHSLRRNVVADDLYLRRDPGDWRY